MAIVRIENNKVVEVIPSYAIPVADYYGEAFARLCMEAPDDVQPNWVYSPTTREFSEPSEPLPPSSVEALVAENKLLKAQIQAQTERSDFIEDCIAEMATQVYGGV